MQSSGWTCRILRIGRYAVEILSQIHQQNGFYIRDYFIFKLIKPGSTQGSTILLNLVEPVHIREAFEEASSINSRLNKLTSKGFFVKTDLFFDLQSRLASDKEYLPSTSVCCFETLIIFQILESKTYFTAILRVLRSRNTSLYQRTKIIQPCTCLMNNFFRQILST